MSNQRYWMASRDPREIIRKLSPYDLTGPLRNSSCPMMQTWYRNSYAYYANVLEPSAWDSSLIFDGEQGELVRMLVPEARSLIRQLVTLVTKQPLNFKCKADREGSDVMMETRLGNAVARHVVSKNGLDSTAELALEGAFVTGMHFIKASWRTDKGDVWSGTKDKLVYTGDLDITEESVADVLWNWRIKSWGDQPWVRVRTRKSRWDLIAQFPHLKTAILQLPPAGGAEAVTNSYEIVFDDDLVDCYEVYHALTPALPLGRMLFYSDERTVYFDAKNVYGCIPVEPLIPERINGMCLGYPVLSNLLPCQEMLDHSMSAIATNQSAHAVQNVAAPRGAGVTWEEMAGMNWFTYTPQAIPGGGKPEGINLTQTPKEVFEFMQVIGNHMGNLSSVNSALRGQPPPGVTSGKAIATLVANAVEFLNSADKAYSTCVRKAMMHSMNAYRRFAKVERLVMLGGKGLQSYSKKFVGKDLDPIQDVDLERVNPMLATIGGRMDLAEKLIDKGFIKNIQHFMSVLNGDDPVETMFKTELGEEDLIRSENERLLEGQPVLGMNSDDHGAHFRSHMALLNDPNVRNNNAEAVKILDHAMWHYSQAKGNVDPFLMALARTGKIPEGGPPPGPGGPPPGGPGGPPPGGPAHPPAMLPAADKGGGPGAPGTGASPATPAADELGRSAA